VKSIQRYCLNEEVAGYLLKHQSLYLAWRACVSPYDGDVDPLHNPDWVARQKLKERNVFSEVVSVVNQYTLEWESFQLT
jgi:hypothetical protein